jgi:hypothetical protein
MLADGISTCEFDEDTLALINTMSKRATMAPRISASLFGYQPVQNSLELRDLDEYKHFNILSEKFPLSNLDKVDGKVVRLSAYIKPEQLASEEAVTKLVTDLQSYFGVESKFLQSIDYNVEHYTNENSGIRLDFYVVKKNE